ncbi:MAG: hypothetical protein D6B26_06695 [Spirochaetaceae bacterium]|nr:MAG: hypothetical protein D6B26_06695 [Spirochaetaceae bacterium]
MAGTLAVKDLPEAWNARMQEYLGIAPGNDSEGVLQDVHWAHGSFGYFPTYALGNIYAAQFSQAMQRDLGDLDSLIINGDFAAILGWLRTNIHQWGRGKTPLELLNDTTGVGVSGQPFLDSLNKKYREIYCL